MKKRFIVLAMAGLFGLGYVIGCMRTGERVMTEEFIHWRQLAELDRNFLTNIITRPSELVTGNYILETRFPGAPVKIDSLSLTFSNHQFALSKPSTPHRHGMADTLIQMNNIVSWRAEGILYEADAEFVGVIDADTISGRVYGWNPGNESIGFWRIYPEPTKFQTGATNHF